MVPMFSNTAACPPPVNWAGGSSPNRKNPKNGAITAASTSTAARIRPSGTSLRPMRRRRDRRGAACLGSAWVSSGSLLSSSSSPREARRSARSSDATSPCSSSSSRACSSLSCTPSLMRSDSRRICGAPRVSTTPGKIASMSGSGGVRRLSFCPRCRNAYRRSSRSSSGRFSIWRT